MKGGYKMIEVNYEKETVEDEEIGIRTRSKTDQMAFNATILNDFSS